jgi:uncharacterized membrane protein HdeD (DUF308 family)
VELTDDVDLSRDVSLILLREWPVALFVGIVTVGLGVAILSWPGETLAVVSVLVGIQFVLFGLFRLIGAFAHSAPVPVLSGVAGVLLIVAGVIVIRRPFDVVEVLAAILGAMWIVGGVIDVLGASGLVDQQARARGERRWLTALSGLVSIVAGVIVVAWPAPTVAVIAWIACFYLIVFGLALAGAAVGLRSSERAEIL